MGCLMERSELAAAPAVIGPLEEGAVRAVWPFVQEYLQNALLVDGGKVSLDDLFKQIGEGTMGLYVVQDFANGDILAAICCEVHEYPNVNVFNVAYLGGRELYRWASLFGELEAEAVRLGCEIVRMTGRPGWGRIYPDYREVARVFERRVVQ